MATVTIPRTITKETDFVIIPRKEYERFLHMEKDGTKDAVTEKDVLRWSREAQKLHKAGKLRVLSSLKDLR